MNSVISSASAPPIDAELLLYRCGGNVPFALMLLDELEATGEQRVEEMVDLAANNLLTSLSDAAHGLKGAAGIIGAERLRSLTQEIERRAESQQHEDLTSAIAGLSQEMASCLAYLPALRKHLTRGVEAHAVEGKP